MVTETPPVATRLVRARELTTGASTERPRVCVPTLPEATEPATNKGLAMLPATPLALRQVSEIHLEDGKEE